MCKMKYVGTKTVDNHMQVLLNSYMTRYPVLATDFSFQVNWPSSCTCRVTTGEPGLPEMNFLFIEHVFSHARCTRVFQPAPFNAWKP